MKLSACSAAVGNCLVAAGWMDSLGPWTEKHLETKPGQSLDERETSGNKAWITDSWSHLETITLGGEDNWKQQFVYWREETMIYSLG